MVSDSQYLITPADIPAARHGVKAITGKPKQHMLPHLSKCPLVVPELREIARLALTSGKENLPPTPSTPVASSPHFSAQNSLYYHHQSPTSSHLSLSPVALTRVDTIEFDTLSTPEIQPLKRQRSKQMPWTTEVQREFDEDFCKMLVSTASAWNFAANPQVHKFHEKWIGPNCVIPDRRTLSGPVLDRLVGRVEEKMKEKLNGKLAMGQCDGWKNVAKQSIIASMFTIASEVHLHAHVTSYTYTFIRHISYKHLMFRLKQRLATTS